jgi:protein SPIRAL1 and related proteins
VTLFSFKMSRGGSAGGGQSSLGYLFGTVEAPAPKPEAAAAAAAPAVTAPPAEKPAAAKADVANQTPAVVASQTNDVSKQTPAGVASQTNNYHQADGQNTGNFLTVCHVHFFFSVAVCCCHYSILINNNVTLWGSLAGDISWLKKIVKFSSQMLYELSH